MNENVRIAQIRVSVFLSENIGFEPSVAEKFKESLMPRGEFCAVIPGQGGKFVASPAHSTQIPWGATWGIMNDTSGRIMFLPGKIDFVKDYDSLYERNEIQDYIAWVVNSISTLNDNLNARNVAWHRIAYAPLLALTAEGCDDVMNCMWDNIMHVQTLDGGPLEERSVSYLQKKVVDLRGKGVHLNLHHTILDGVRFFADGRPDQKATLIQLDLNTIPGSGSPYSMDEITAFYDLVVSMAEALVEKIINC